MIRKSKSLHTIMIEGCQIQTQLKYNTNTNHIGISTTYQYHKTYNKSHTIIGFLGKLIKTDLPKLKYGYHYHHVIYDHLNKDKYVVPMTRSKYMKLHIQMKRDKVEISHINRNT